MAERLSKELGSLLFWDTYFSGQVCCHHFGLESVFPINGSELSHVISMNVQWASHKQVKIGTMMTGTHRQDSKTGRPVKLVGLQFGVPYGSFMFT